MTQWSDQIAEFQRNWVTQQQKLLQDWLSSMKSAGADSPRAGWRQAADVMEQQVDSALDAQKRSLLTIAENLEEFDNAPEAFTEAMKQLEQGIEEWTEVQHRMWHVWFDMIRSTAPTPQTPGEAMMESWEDMVKQTMSIQEEWLSRLSGQQSGAGGSARKKTGKGSGAGSGS